MIRFPELPENPDRQHHHHQHHHLHGGLPAAPAGPCHTLNTHSLQVPQRYTLTSSFCLQESISDFYWYYSGKDIMDEPGKRNFSKAMTVAKQVFNSLTEYIQVKRVAPQLVCRETKTLISHTALNLHLSSPSGSLYWKPAVTGPQQVVGRCGRLPARLRSHDDETRSGEEHPNLVFMSLSFTLFNFWDRIRRIYNSP